MDRLSEVLELVDVRSVVSGGFAVRGPWVSRADLDDSLKFVAVPVGRVRLTTADGEVELGPGDVAVLNHQSWFELRGGEGDGPPVTIEPDPRYPGAMLADAGTDAGKDGHDVVIGGHATLNATGRTLLSQALPPVAHVRASAASSPRLQDCLDRVFDEIRGAEPGSGFAMRQYGQLFLLEVVRAYVGQADLPPGWLRVLTDERLQPALALMHDQPGRSWHLAELAEAASMSRTTFAERFRLAAGVPPLTYLSQWRVRLAQRSLMNGDVRVGELARALGYSSESAFSTAFKREVGVAPSRYRSSVDPHPAGSATA